MPSIAGWGQSLLTKNVVNSVRCSIAAQAEEDLIIGSNGLGDHL